MFSGFRDRIRAGFFYIIIKSDCLFWLAVRLLFVYVPPIR